LPYLPQKVFDLFTGAQGDVIAAINGVKSFPGRGAESFEFGFFLVAFLEEPKSFAFCLASIAEAIQMFRHVYVTCWHVPPKCRLAGLALTAFISLDGKEDSEAESLEQIRAFPARGKEKKGDPKEESAK
jgi:hypothetical protein